MSTTLTIVIVLVVLLTGTYFFIKYRNKQKLDKLIAESKASSIKMHQEVTSQLSPIYSSLTKGETPSTEIITQLANNPKTRFKLYEALLAYKKDHLFPAEFYNHEALSESQLVYRVQHVHALGSVPDVIQFDDKIKLIRDGKELTYYMFRLKMDPPHPTAEKGWLRATCGPYESHHSPHSLILNLHFGELTETTNIKAHAEKVHDEFYQEPSEEIRKLLNLA